MDFDLYSLPQAESEWGTPVLMPPAKSCRFRGTHMRSTDLSTTTGNSIGPRCRVVNASRHTSLTQLPSKKQGCRLPNTGSPNLATDSLVFCSAIVSAMYGDWRSQPGTVVLSSYLLSLTNQWSAYGFPGSGRTWLAASGRACPTPTRLAEGCRDQNPYSDGVVCQDSAAYNVSTSIGTQPNSTWSDPNAAYVHSFSFATGLILCPTTDRTKYLPLYDPPPTPGGLFAYLATVLNGM